MNQLANTHTFCPATMCPLFAANGSPWTGKKNSPCDHEKCGWWQGCGGAGCDGASTALEQIADLSVNGRVLVISSSPRYTATKPTDYDCPAAATCQWQHEATDATKKLCPPRFALSLGLDPRACAY